MMTEIKIEMGDRVRIKASGETGKVIEVLIDWAVCELDSPPVGAATHKRLRMSDLEKLES